MAPPLAGIESGYVIDAFFLVNFVFGLIFAGAAYNHSGDGVVHFQNIPHDKISESDRDNTYKNLYLGWDKACQHVEYDPINDVRAHTDCFSFQPMNDRELNVLVPITWVLIMFGFAHFCLKRVYIRSERFRGMLDIGWVKFLVMILLFYGPIVLFVVSMIYWSWFTERRDTISPLSDDAEPFPGDSKHTDVKLFNDFANDYKKTQFLGAGSTWSVILLLVGQFFQAIACIIAIARNVANNTNKDSTWIARLIQMEEGGFVGENDENLRPTLASSVAAPVDAAAKKPETKAAAAPRVTSVYANRRVTNGISF